MDVVLEIGLTCISLLPLMGVIGCLRRGVYKKGILPTCLGFLAIIFFIIGCTNIIPLEKVEFAVLEQHMVKSIVWFLGGFVFSVLSNVFCK